jgi:phospholipid-translocating ATPase
VGTLQWGGETLSIPPTSILLRDSKLRNTEWVVGAVVFTGHDTKVMQNATDPPSKRSSLEKQMDKIIIALFLWLFIMAFVTGLVYGETHTGASLVLPGLL